MNRTSTSEFGLFNPRLSLGFGFCAMGLLLMLRAFADPAPLQLMGAVSRVTHNFAGTFDVNLPLTGMPGVECRSFGGATLVMTFNNPVVSGNANVTSGIASVAGTSFSGNTMTVTLTGVANAQTVTIILSNVTDIFSQVLQDTAINASFLLGDSTGDGFVGPVDRTYVQQRLGMTANATNFRADVISDGNINAFDLATVTAHLGEALPQPPSALPPGTSTDAIDPSGTAINLTEANLIESQTILGPNCQPCTSCGWDKESFKAPINIHGLKLTLTYNSRDADGSRASLDTVLGYGWTHTFNVFLFSQTDGSMFRYAANGRVIKYTLNPDNTFTTDTGYFETLVRTSSNTFRLTQNDGTNFTFTSIDGTPFIVGNGVYRLIRAQDRNNDTLTVIYANGTLLRVNDAYGQTLNFAYNSRRRIVSVTDPLGRITTFGYDSSGTQLTSITDPQGKTISYTYNSRNQVTNKTDKDGRQYVYAYTNSAPGKGGRLFSQTNPNSVPTSIRDSAGGLIFSVTYEPSLTTKTDGNGNLSQYQYDAHGYLTTMTISDGAITTYTYDPATLMPASTTDPNGHATAYEYDSQGNRTRMTDALGYMTAYTYESVFNMMTSMTDAKGRVTSYAYDAQGNRIQEIDPLLQTRSWTYDSHGNVLTETDKNGHTTSYTYNSLGQMTSRSDSLGNITTMTYDTVSNLLSRTDANGHTTTYEYDALDRRIRETDAAGHDSMTAYDNMGNRISTTDRNGHTSTFEYDLRQRLITTTDALGNFDTNAYDANNNRIATTDRNGHTTTFAYDNQNRLIQTTDALGNTDTQVYDAVGNVLNQTDANGHMTTNSYDALNRRFTTTEPLEDNRGICRAFVTQLEYDTGGSGCPMCGVTPGSSLVTKQVDGNGKVTYFKYDSLDRLVKTVSKVGPTDDTITPVDAVTATIYDPVGNRLSTTEPNGNTIVYEYDAIDRRTRETNAAGDVTLTGYDGVGNVTSAIAPNGNVTTYIYDSLDRLIQVDDSVGRLVSSTYDNVGNRLSQTDGNNNSTNYTYDELNRRDSTTDPLGQTSTNQYDAVGNMMQVTDREGRITRYNYDALNRRTSMTEAVGTPEQRMTTYTYDAVGNQIAITDANGHITTYAYDAHNRRILATYPDPAPNTRTFAYDAVNMISRTDQRGDTTNYTYNDLYFMTARSYPSGLSDSFTYDLSGRMLTAQRGPWLVAYSYDGANRVTKTVQNGGTINYTYDIPGRTRSVTYPGGRQITEHTDARTRLDHIDDAGSPTPIVQYNYDLGNRIGTRTYRNGTVAAYTYNANNWATSLEHMFGATRIAGFGYDFDHEGNKKFEEKRHDPNHSEHYQYDDLYRLVNYQVAPLPSPTPIITQTAYNLDAVGNWNSKTTDGVTQTRTHNPVNELTMIDATSLTYDDNGNLQNDGTYTYAYDEENRLTQVTRDSDSAVVGQYQYDALSRRVKKIANPAGTSIETRYFYDNARIIEEQSSIGATLATYVYGSYIDEVLSMDRGGQTVFYHQNSLGSVEAITNATGTPVERYSYDAYGQPSVFDGSGSPIPPNSWGTPHSAIGNPWLFTGRQLDEETGLYFYRARDYDAEKGRFLQRDPLEYVDGMNLYLYVSDNPANRLDPKGTEACPARCGLDITKLMEQGLTKVEARFLAKSGDDQQAICKATREILGWDTVGLIGEAPKKLLSRPPCGNKPCEYTVTINGECHWAAAVNYMLYGKVSRLCRDNLNWQQLAAYTEFTTVNFVRAYRGAKSGLGIFGMGIGPPVAWTKVGYNNNDYSLASGEKLDAKCPACDRKYGGPLTFRVGPTNWFPLFRGGLEEQPHHIKVTAQETWQTR